MGTRDPRVDVYIARSADFDKPYWKESQLQREGGAFYYVRVIEIPAPRWTTYDAKVFGTKIPQGACAHQHPGPRLYLAHLVYACEVGTAAAVTGVSLPHWRTL